MGPEIRKNSHKGKVIAALIFLLILAIGALVMKRYKNPSDNNSNTQSQTTVSEQQKFPAINGLPVYLTTAQTRPIGIMIENSPEARPQSGLADADIVYETLAEGGITRFFVIYQTATPNNIGPVRSARDYFAQLANEWGVIFVHVGGSDEVLTQLAANRYKNLDDVNQFYYGKYFERITTRQSPHNVYTSIDKIRTLAEDEKFSESTNYEPWQFSGQTTDEPNANTASSITIKFSTSLFDAKFIYNSGTNRYDRLLAGKPHIDQETKQQLTVDTLIVQYVPISATPNDPKARVDIGLEGQGKAYIFENGKVIQGQWKKIKEGRTEYYDQNGNVMVLHPGKIWVALTTPGTMTFQPAIANTSTNQ